MRILRNLKQWSSTVTGTAHALRLVFTIDGVEVGVVIRSAERCDLVKIKLSEWEAEHRLRLCRDDLVAYDPVKTALSESEAEAKE